MASGMATSVISASTRRTAAANARMPTVSHEPLPMVRNHDGTWNVVISRWATAATRRACDSASSPTDTRPPRDQP